ncbi:MAG: polyribonucleotide nucleotidyltransferase [Candidatus Absconditabacterales bacterium]|nr:polyribonucleotide nucleotidyltransferase [Candidatus Absconditabacterales bacterium]
MITSHSFSLTTHTIHRGNHILSFETGKLAPQADASVVVRLGDNVLLVTVCIEKTPNPDKDFLPLTVDWRDSYGSAGKIGGGPYRKRESRPSDNAILYSRMVDRAIRPLFPKYCVNDIVLTITPLVIDREQDLGVLSIIGASTAVMMTGIPFDGPVGAVRLGHNDEGFVLNPSREQITKSQLNLLTAGPRGVINMIECDAPQAPDDLVLQAFALSQKQIDAVIDAQAVFLSQCTKPSFHLTFSKPHPDLLALVYRWADENEVSHHFFSAHNKTSFNTIYSSLLTQLERFVDTMHPDHPGRALLGSVWFTYVRDMVRMRTLTQGIRADGRDKTMIRPLFADVGLFDRLHGSGLFRRGDTQVMTTLTLGGPTDVQLIDTMEYDEVEQRYIHHYNFPGFSVNEAKPTRGAGRREIGHGALAEKALEHVLPPLTQFPYTMRLVSECLSSGGSTSMASVCASTLALLDGGVPIQAPVAGIAMGLFTQTASTGSIEKYVILTDLSGTEDFVGDMDFKVAGTRTGITAIQLDTKIRGLSYEMIAETILAAREARIAILDFMGKIINQPRATVSPFAPKIHSFLINPAKIRDVIGKGGEMIDKIIEQAGGVKIDFKDDGTVIICDRDAEKIAKAEALIRDIADDLPLNTPLQATVTKVESYGVFVSLPKNKSGLLHIKAMNLPPNTNVATQWKIGDSIAVLVTGIDDQGRPILIKA